MSAADLIDAMKAEGLDAETILSVVARVDAIKADRAREKTRNRVRRYRETKKAQENNDPVTDVTVTDVTSVTPPPQSPLFPPHPLTPPLYPPRSYLQRATCGARMRRFGCLSRLRPVSPPGQNRWT